jgi:hypothetical protein
MMEAATVVIMAMATGATRTLPFIDLMIIYYVKVTDVTKNLLKLKEPINNIDNDSKNI